MKVLLLIRPSEAASGSLPQGEAQGVAANAQKAALAVGGTLGGVTKGVGDTVGNTVGEFAVLLQNPLGDAAIQPQTGNMSRKSNLDSWQA